MRIKILVLFTCFISACTESKFSAIDPAAKAQAIKTTTVLPRSGPNTEPEGQIPQGGQEQQSPYALICTHMAPPSKIATTSARLFLVKSLQEAPTCEIGNVQMNIEHQTLTVPDLQSACKGLNEGSYFLVGVNGGDSVFEVSGFLFKPILINQGLPLQTVDVKADGTVRLTSSGPVPILTSLLDEPGSNQVCAARVDPLMLDLNDGAQDTPTLSLTDALNGVLFDILGSTGTPAHSPKRVAWMEPGNSAGHFFIALPDSRGRVQGIDQLFGDRTQGPDGKLASDGFAALAKYDGLRADGSVDAAARDGLIDDKDEVFHRLRFWNDQNFDGIAQPSELKSAAQLGIVAIDLRYDPNFSETDSHGNTARFKSVAKTRDGRLHLVYDLYLQVR